MATAKQKEAFDRTIENHGNVSKSMREVGYSEAHSTNPQELTKSKGWKELMDEHLSETSLAEEHQKVLKQDRDLNAKNKAIDMGYKLRGNYEPDQLKIILPKPLADV